MHFFGCDKRSNLQWKCFQFPSLVLFNTQTVFCRLWFCTASVRTCCWTSEDVSPSWCETGERWRRPVNTLAHVSQAQNQKHFFSCDAFLRNSQHRWRSSCWWFHKAPGRPSPYSHPWRPARSSGPSAPESSPRCLSEYESDPRHRILHEGHTHSDTDMTHRLRVHKTIENSENTQQLRANSPALTDFSPPPHRRHRARSFPVPRGSTATGGRPSRLALSEKDVKWKKSRMSQTLPVWKLTLSFYRASSDTSPMASRIHPTVPSPPHTRIL